MIVYGTESKELAKEQLTEDCWNCSAKNTIDMHIFQKYAHILWLPLFPLSKTGISQCDNCKQIFYLNEMPPHLRNAYETIKVRTKKPIWMFSGLGVIAALILLVMYSNAKRNKMKAELLLAPISGDVYSIKKDIDTYTLIKVDKVRGDTIYIKPHNYETDKSSGLFKLKKKGDFEYAENTYPILKGELKQMFDKGDIIDIERK
jgi:hypothetical protein